jgi:hypothetical protein
MPSGRVADRTNKILKVCVICKETFQAYKVRAEFRKTCGKEECKSAYRIQKKTDAEHVYKTCPICKAVFYASKSRAWRITCGMKECKKAYRQQKYVSKVCPICKEVFHTLKSHSMDYITCGKEECKKAYRKVLDTSMRGKENIKNRGDRNSHYRRVEGYEYTSSGKAILICQNPSCRKAFFVLPVYVRRNRKYCSYKCSNGSPERLHKLIIAHRNGKWVPCAFCGKPVYRSKSKIDKTERSFCDRACFLSSPRGRRYFNRQTHGLYDYTFFSILAEDKGEKCPWPNCSRPRAKYKKSKWHPFRLCLVHASRISAYFQNCSKRKEVLFKEHGIVEEKPIRSDDPHHSDLSKITKDDLDRMFGTGKIGIKIA